MGIRKASIQRAVDSAFKALGDIPEGAILRRTTSTYSPATGDRTTSTTDYAITKAVFVRFEQFEIDKIFILSTDVKLIIRQNEIAVAPSNTDTIIRGGKVYNIVRSEADPSDSIYILQLRSPA